MKHLLTIVVMTAFTAGCGAGTAPNAAPAASPSGPRSVDVVRVIERPLDVDLSLPGELTPYQTVAVYARVTGFG